MIAPKVKTEDINDDIEEKVLGKDNFVSTNNIDQSNVSQEPQKAKEEQIQAYIEDSDRVSEKIEHTVDPIVMSLSENPIGSSDIKSIVPVVLQEDQVIEVPHIDFIFGNHRWIVNVHAPSV